MRAPELLLGKVRQVRQTDSQICGFGSLVPSHAMPSPLQKHQTYIYFFNWEKIHIKLTCHFKVNMGFILRDVFLIGKTQCLKKIKVGLLERQLQH